MRLNTLKPAHGAKQNKKRLGRGIGSGMGKTSGHGHKGQTARSGYNRKVGFEGGQVPLQRRVPKFGFTSEKAKKTAEIRLTELNKISEERIGLAELKKHNLVRSNIGKVKIILSGTINKAVVIYGENIGVTKGARSAIEAVGGKIGE